MIEDKRYGEVFLLQDPITLEIHIYLTMETATKDAIKRNKESDNHPAYRMYICPIAVDQAFLHGTLYRKFGMDFDPENCWEWEVREGPAVQWNREQSEYLLKRLGLHK